MGDKKYATCWLIYELLYIRHNYDAIAGAGRELHLFFSRSVKKRDEDGTYGSSVVFDSGSHAAG